jgi:hypothetical protein
VITTGGAEDAVQTLALALHSAGVDFFVIVPPRTELVGNEDELFPFEIVEVGAPGASQTEFIRAAGDLLLNRLQTFDVIWSQSHGSQRLAERLPNTPQLATYHESGELQSGHTQRLPNLWFRFVSDSQRGIWAREDWEQSRSTAIHYGFDNGEQMRRCASEEYHLYVADLSWGKRKGVHIVLELAFMNPDELFHIYGGGSAPAIKNMLATVGGLLPNVVVMGQLERGAMHTRVFCRAQTLLMPTQIPEAFELAIAEAMMNGVPVVGSNFGALPELLQGDERLGIATGSIEKMSAALTRDYDRDFIAKRAAEHFSSRREVAQLLQYSRSMLSSMSSKNGEEL